MTLRTLVIIATLISLSGCATNIYSSSKDSYESPVSYKKGELNGETIFDILAAELAGQKNQYPYSLEKYLKQAKLTKDPGIAKRAVRIAQHLRDPVALKKAIDLWVIAAPDAAEPRQILANILMSQGKFQQAIPHFNLALKNGKKQILLLLTSEAHKMSEEDALSYIKLLQNAEQTEEIKADVFLTLGILYRQIEQPHKAIEHFDKALSLTSDLPTATYQKADALKQIGKYKEALEVVTAYLKKNQHSTQFQALEVQLLFLSNKNKEALLKVEKLVKDYPNEPQLINYLALTTLDFKELETSRSILQTLLKRTPDDSSPYFYLGIIAEREDNVKKAIDMYLKVNRGRNFLQAQTRAISLHTGKQQQADVQKIATEAINKNPKNKTTYQLVLSEWFNNNDLTTEAIKLISKILANDPKNTNLLYTRALYSEPLDFKAAENDFKAILAIEPENAVVLNAYGYTLTLRTDRYAEAKKLIQQALSLKPNDPASLDSMGWVLFKLERYEEATQYLQKAYRLFNDPEVASHLIRALSKINRHDEAEELLQKLILTHPNSEFIVKTRKMIEKQQ